jgi:endonuclease/exonuclease/phosphatase family metal-dependent hydrolase
MKLKIITLNLWHDLKGLPNQSDHRRSSTRIRRSRTSSSGQKKGGGRRRRSKTRRPQSRRKKITIEDRQKNGLKMIVKIIQDRKPDIIGFQECSEKTLIHICNMLLLDPQNHISWSSLRKNCHKRYGAGIISFFPIKKLYEDKNKKIGLNGLGILIHLDDKTKLRYFNVHLNWRPYGPKLINTTSPDECVKRTYNAMGKDMIDILHNLVNHKNNDIDSITLLGGDFNIPSHLDWTEETKHLHFDSVVKWPVSELLEKEDFIDVYRHINVSPLKYPGNTWPCKSKEEMGFEPISDRIDSIYCKNNPNIDFLSSQEFIYNNDKWISDHKGVEAIINISN